MSHLGLPKPPAVKRPSATEVSVDPVEKQNAPNVSDMLPKPKPPPKRPVPAAVEADPPQVSVPEDIEITEDLKEQNTENTPIETESTSDENPDNSEIPQEPQQPTKKKKTKRKKKESSKKKTNVPPPPSQPPPPPPSRRRKLTVTRRPPSPREDEKTELSGETIPIEIHNELKRKYEELEIQFKQQSIYVLALEKTIDLEREMSTPNLPLKKEVSIASATKHRLKSASQLCTTSATSVFNRDTSKEHIQSEANLKRNQDKLKKANERKELLRKQQTEARLKPLKEKKQLHRMNILQEILNTEKDYFEILQILVRVQSVLLENNIISNDENESLFSNAAIIAKLHQNNVKLLDSRYLSVPDEECWNVSLSDIFEKFAGELSVYTNYINNQIMQAKVMDTCCARKTFISSLYYEIPEFEMKELVETKLRSYLIAPIQRICKYPLLLKELIGATDKSHLDYDLLQLALEKIQKSTMVVNERKKVSEQTFQMQQIEESLEGVKGFDLNVYSRVLVKQGNLLKLSKGKTQERHFYLFDDLIIYGSKSLLPFGKAKINVKGKIFLDKIKINDLPDSEIHQNCFELVRLDHKKKKYIISSKLSGAQGKAEKDSWLLALRTQTNYTE